METWAPYLDRFGLAIAILAVVAYFAIRHYWPYWKGRDQQRESDRRDQMNRMLNLQEVSMKEMTEAIRAGTRQSEKVAEHMEALTDEIHRKQ
jgi:hypothetical protein